MCIMLIFIAVAIALFIMKGKNSAMTLSNLGSFYNDVNRSCADQVGFVYEIDNIYR